MYEAVDYCIDFYFVGGKIQYFHKTETKKIEAMKIAFITKRLDLTPDESQRFWPFITNTRAEKNKLDSLPLVV